MNVWNKVFLGIIIVTSIAVVALGAVEFHIRNAGQKKVSDLEQKIAKANEDIAKMMTGADPLKISAEKSPSEWEFDEIKGQIVERFDQRGRAWFGCQILDAKEKTLAPTLPQVETQVIITSPFAPNETNPDTDVIIPEILKGVVYAFEIFESKDESGTITAGKPGKFLGRFTVESVPTPTKFLEDEAEKNGFAVTLVTADPLNPDEIKCIVEAATPEYKAEHPESRWAIYMTPPVHQIAGVFDQLTDEERIQLMASQPVTDLSEEDKQKLLDEFKQTFEPAPRAELTEVEKAENDPQVIAMWEKFRQSMDDPETDQARGFAAALNWLYLQRNSLNRDIAIMQTNIETSTAAKEKNDVENTKLEADCVLEEKRRKAMEEQGTLVKELNKQYTDEESNMKLQIEKHQALQELYVGKIAEYQLKAVETIEGQAGEKTADTR